MQLCKPVEHLSVSVFNGFPIFCTVYLQQQAAEWRTQYPWCYHRRHNYPRYNGGNRNKKKKKEIWTEINIVIIVVFRADRQPIKRTVGLDALGVLEVVACCAEDNSPVQYLSCWLVEGRGERSQYKPTSNPRWRLNLRSFNFCWWHIWSNSHFERLCSYMNHNSPAAARSHTHYTSLFKKWSLQKI